MLSFKRSLLILFFISSLINAHAQELSKKTIDSLMKEAMKYYKGEGRPADTTRCFVLSHLCADAGNRVAMYNLGQFFIKGWGCEENKDSALYWYNKAGEKGYAKAYYRLGHAYKTGRLGNPDYDKAWLNFCKAADMNYPSGIYYKGYMLYTGLGCKQDYGEAYPLFRIAAQRQDANAMHFTGLCMYNGYGTTKNRDSAQYWFRKSREAGWRSYDDSYGANGPANADIASRLFKKVKAAQALVKPDYLLNTYMKITNDLPAGELEGIYEGWLLTYDWGGQHVVKADLLHVELQYENDSLKGIWRENDTMNITIKAMLTRNGLLFNDMQYKKGDHYYNTRGSLLKFDKAQLRMVKQPDADYLYGNLQLYAVNRKEPAKPMYIALVRTKKKSTDQLIPYVNDDGSVPDIKNVNVFPNPFIDIINVDFELEEKAPVNTELIDINGKTVYKNNAGILEPGIYRLPIQPNNLLNAVYLLKIQYGKKSKTVKLVKQG